MTLTKYGRWIVEMPNEYTKITKCSICGESAPFICVSGDYYGRYMHGETQMTKYCPNCGAKMDLRKEQEDNHGFSAERSLHREV